MTTLLGNDFNCTTDDKSSRSFKNRINLIEGKEIWKNVKKSKEGRDRERRFEVQGKC